MPSASSKSPSPSPPPSRPTALHPGPRAQTFQTLYNTTLSATLRTISYPSFSSCFPTIAANAPENLQLMHKTMLERLEKFAKDEFEQIVRERNVVEQLNALEDLIADAKRRKARGVDGEGNGGGVVPPHLLPAPEIARAHLASLYASQQSQLNAKLQTTQSQNATLAETIRKQREEIEGLLRGVEAVVKDLDGANELLEKETDDLAREAISAEVEMKGY